jgi:hypothetical protein
MSTSGTRLFRAVALCAALAAAIELNGQGLPITSERLLNSGKEPGNWLMYSRTYNGWRFSPLDQINTENVNRLKVKWLFQGRHQEKFETTPLVVDGRHARHPSDQHRPRQRRVPDAAGRHDDVDRCGERREPAAAWHGAEA